MKSPETPARENPGQSGREAISVEKAVKTQIELIWRLTPPKIQDLIPAESKEKLLTALRDSKVLLFEAINDSKVKKLLDLITNNYHMSKYVDATFHGFAIFCDKRANDQDFIDRVNQGKLSEEDFKTMEIFIKNQWEEGQFFGSETEIEDFISEYNQSVN